LELGDWEEASKELDRISPPRRGHPSVLEVRWQVCAKTKKWEMATKVAQEMAEKLPDHPLGFIHQAYSLHELKRTQEAYAVLLPVADKFPDLIIRYNLACYCCQLGELTESMQWLGKAIELAGKNHIRLMALDDEDLQPLWGKISSI